MAYNTKKYLDEEGLKQVIRLLDEYPDNQILGTVIDEIQSELDKKADVVSIPEVPVQDVQINETSVVSNGVANIPIATLNGEYGIVKLYSGLGIGLSGQNNLMITTAIDAAIKNGTNNYSPITPYNQEKSTFYGLAKAAGDTTQSQSSNVVGTYTPEAKGAIQKMLGVSDLIATEENNLIASKAYAVGDVFTANGKLYKATAAIAVDGAIITDGANANCEETNVGEGFVKKTDLGDYSNYGIVKLKQHGGLQFDSSTGGIKIDPAGSGTIKAGTSSTYPLASNRQHEVVFFGLSKAAGVDLASETVTVGTYPVTASAAIRNMLGAVGDVQVDETSIVSNGVANIPMASTNTLGVVGVGGSFGIKINENGKLYIDTAGSNAIKSGNVPYSPISVMNQHKSVFYGLAKAAGDTTQSQSDNAVGTYTDEAKAAIKAMLGIQDGSTGTVDVSGTAPTITAVENTRYVCGEVTSLSFTPPASGISIVRFTSGSTVTVLTIPSTVKFPEWFDSTSLETNTIYEICVTDGEFGAVMSWAL